MTAAAAAHPERVCVICGAPVIGGRQGPPPICCTDPECRAERNRRYSRAYTAQLRGAVLRQIQGRREGRQSGGRAGTLRGTALARVVARDRDEHSELRGVEWQPCDCPRRRGDDCPCIHIACRYHLCGEVGPDGCVWVDPRFEEDPYSVATCAIDAALDNPDGLTLAEVGAIFDLTRERIRQVEAKGIRRLEHPARLPMLSELLELAEDGIDERADRGGLASVSGGHRAEGCFDGRDPRNRGLQHSELRVGPLPCRHPSEPHAWPEPERLSPRLPPSLTAAWGDEAPGIVLTHPKGPAVWAWRLVEDEGEMP